MSKKREDHVLIHMKGVVPPVCKYCGLIGLKNEATRKALRQRCKGTHDEE